MVSFLGMGLFVTSISLWMGGLGLAGVANLKTACRQIFVAGIFTLILTAWLLVGGLYLPASIMGVVSWALLEAGLGGLAEGHDYKTVGQSLSIVGVFAIIMGAYLIYMLNLLWTGMYAIIAGIVLQLYLSACYGKAAKACGWGVVALMIIDTIISFGIAWGLLV